MKIKNKLENDGGGGVECLYTGISNPFIIYKGGVSYD